MNGESRMSDDGFKKCVDFHGHICHGIAIGFRAAQVLMDRLGVLRSPDEELVAVVETDACGSDAIQVMTGCTFGKGNFIFKNYGKHAFSLSDRKQERTVRVCLQPDAIKTAPDHLPLIEKVRNEKATPEEMERFRQLQQERVRRIIEADPSSLFKVEEAAPLIPPLAKIVKSETCDICGESTKADLLRVVNGRKVCIPCWQQKRVIT
jgi:formylmethanofuran dehydrogenase subunit E